jgi:4-hydroxy-L-threonine phosphate dehydrogenase PdxA
LGREEIEVINPVLKAIVTGINMSLSLPADTLFTPENLKDAMLFCDVSRSRLTCVKIAGFW